MSSQIKNNTQSLKKQFKYKLVQIQRIKFNSVKYTNFHLIENNIEFQYEHHNITQNSKFKYQIFSLNYIFIFKNIYLMIQPEFNTTYGIYQPRGTYIRSWSKL